MRKIRLAICDKNSQNVQFYVGLCRRLGQHCDVQAEYKAYQTHDNLLFDLGDQLFREKLDMILFMVSDENDKQTLTGIRKSGFSGVIIALGDIDKLSVDDYFDVNVFNIIRQDNTKSQIERFNKAFLKAVDTIKAFSDEKLVLSYGGEFRYVPINDIYYFEKQDRGIVVHYKEDESFFFIGTMSKLEEQLKAKGFVRTALSFYANAAEIKQLVRIGRDYEAIINNNLRIPVGRKYYFNLKAELSEMAVAEID